MKKIGLLVVVGAISFVLCLAIQGGAQAKQKVVTLKLAHQWPQNPDDPLVATALKFTEEVTKRTKGTVQFKFYPAQSLIKAKSTFEGLQKGMVDLSILPYPYAAGIVPQLKFSMWECVFPNHDAFFAWRKSKGFELLESKINEKGVKTIVWLQALVGAVSRGKYIATPSDVDGLKIRPNGPYMEILMKAAGAGISTMISTEIYIAAQRGMLDGAVTSSATMAGYKLYEVFDYYLTPLGPSLNAVMEPICISMKTWNNKLNDEQRKIMVEVGKECEPFGLEKVKAYDSAVASMFRDAGDNVRVMTDAEFDKWRELADKVLHPRKRSEVPDGEFFYKDLEESGIKY